MNFFFFLGVKHFEFKWVYENYFHFLFLNLDNLKIKLCKKIKYHGLETI